MKPATPTFCGLDFGTSNSTVSRLGQAGLSQLVRLEGAHKTIPSAIFFSFEDEAVSFGRQAMTDYVSGINGRLMRSLKSVLGTSLMNDSTRIKARSYGFLEILGIFIAEMKSRAEAEIGSAVDTVVVGRPVQFVDDDPVADAAAQNQLESAVRAQGFAQIAFQFEPIAAALDYEQQVADERLALIVDLGGGTSDFSIVRVSPQRSRAADRSGDILSTAGVHVGGTDFDRLLSMLKVMPELGLGTPTLDSKRYLPVAPYYDLSTWHRINRLYTPQNIRDLKSTQREAERPELVETMIELVEDRLGHRLVATVEASKIALSDAESTDCVFPVRETEIRSRITSLDLSEALQASIQRIEDTIAETVRRAGIVANAIDSLILTGGSTQVPAIASRLRALFPAAELVRTDVLGSVGLGLAIDAKRKFG